jgi:hypothetical protein
MAILWFCFIYENFLDIRRPLLAIEELILEFKGLGMIDPMLASLYAGAGAADSSSNYERAMQRNRLEPYYKKARKLVEESCHTSRLP